MDINSNITGIQHIGIPTGDIDNTISFYQKLGFSVAHQTVNPANGCRVAFLKLHQVVVETYEDNDPAMVTGALNHIALDVCDVDDAFEQLSKRGFKLLNEKVQYLPFWHNGVRFFTIEGPNKEKIEFCQINA